MGAVQTNDLPAGETIKVGRWPAFDGLRAVAVVAVMMYHLNYRPWTGGGYLGVDVFFVLSGFLITWLLVTEWDRLGGVSFRRFYARRGLRLLPALAAVIVFVVVIVEAVPAMKTYRHPTLVGLPFVILYSGNWALTFGSSGTLSLGLLGSTWSLAVEEQFYLLWPAILVRLLRRFSRERLAALLTVAAFADMVARQVLNLAHVSWWPWWRSYYASFTHFDGLLLGCALAVAWGQRSAWPWLGRIGRNSGVAGAVAAAGLVAILIRANLDPDLMPLWMSAAALFTIVVMLDCCFARAAG